MTRLEIENELISRLLVYPNQVFKVSQIVTVDDFRTHGKTFQIILNAVKGEKDVTHELIKNKIKISTYDTLTFRKPVDISKDLKNLSNSDKVKNLLEDYSKRITGENINDFLSQLQIDLINKIKSPVEEIGNIDDIMRVFLEEREEYSKKPKGSIIGQTTGYSKLDDVIDGFRPEHLIVVGGYTNSGKTFATLNMVANLIQQNKRVVIYSLEMSINDVVARLLGILSKQNGLAIMKATNKDNIEEAVKQIVNSKLTIINNKSELSEILFSMIDEDLTNPVDLFVVDFIQLITVRGAKSEYETITQSTLELQQIAKRLKKPIVVVSQISNEGAKAQRTDVMSFKGSGAISAAADLAIEIRQNEDDINEYKNKLSKGEEVKMKWLILKNRHGRLGYIEMLFNGYTGIMRQDDAFDKF